MPSPRVMPNLLISSSPQLFFCLEGSSFEGFGMLCAWKNAISKACWIWAARLERKPWPPKVVPEGLLWHQWTLMLCKASLTRLLMPKAWVPSSWVTTPKKVTTAVSAKGAHFNAEYVKEFYKISDGEILAGQLKQCILKHAQSHNTSEWKDGKIASQLVCLLSHVRRLRRDPAKRRQCMQGATGEQRQAIQGFVALPGACKKATLPLQGSSDRKSVV